MPAATPALLRRLRSGRLDVAVVGVGPDLPDCDVQGLSAQVLSRDDLPVAVPDGHRLLRMPRVTAADLGGDAWIVGESTNGDQQFGAWPTLADPRIPHVVRSLATRLGLVAAGRGISLIPGLAVPSLPSGVLAVSVHDDVWPGRAAVALISRSRPPRAVAMVAALIYEAARLEHEPVRST